MRVTFHQPRSLEEALALKQRFGLEAAFVAGGTDLMVLLNHGRSPASAYIDLSHIPNLDYITPVPHEPATLSLPSSYTVGGGTTFAKLAQLPVKCLAEAALSVGGPQIRNRATIAGNLATASPAGDGSTALLALDGELELSSLRSRRRLKVREFFLDYRKTALAPDEMILSAIFPGNWQSGWYKLGKRGAVNISMVCCAVALSEEGEFHVAYGSVGPYPLRAALTEEFLNSALQPPSDDTPAKTLSAAAIDEAARLAASEVRPIDDFRASADYRRAMSGVLLRKILREMLGTKKTRMKAEG